MHTHTHRVQLGTSLKLTHQKLNKRDERSLTTTTFLVSYFMLFRSLVQPNSRFFDKILSLAKVSPWAFWFFSLVCTTSLGHETK